MKFYETQRQSMKFNENQRNSTKIIENQEIQREPHLWYSFFMLIPILLTKTPQNQHFDKIRSAACRERAKPTGRVSGRNNR